MQKLRKQDRQKFDFVCLKIRALLHLEHKQCYYENKRQPEGSTAEAACVSTRSGWYVRIYLYDCFWTMPAENQLRCLIHEHIHAVMIPFDQQVDAAVKRMHEADYELVDAAVDRGRELVVCHLESVLYDLLKACF